MGEFENVVVKKPWGHEREIFNNGETSCWLLRLERDKQTSLHMHEHKETAMILLNGLALLQEGMGASRAIGALAKTRFSDGFYHRHTGITDCDLLEIETPVNKLDVHRFRDEYDRAGKPYESIENYRPVDAADEQFDKYGVMRVGKASIRVVEFIDRAAFRRWVNKLPYGSIVVFLRGQLWSRFGFRAVRLGHANWSEYLVGLMVDTEPDERMQVLFITRDEGAKI